MAVAKMLKLRLVGVNAKQDEILNALHKTGAVELRGSNNFEGLSKTQSDKSEIKNKKERVQNALSIINNKCKELKYDGGQKDGFGVSYGEFMGVKDKQEELLQTATSVEELNGKIASLRAEILATESESAYFAPYADMQSKFSDFKNTSYAFCRLGTIERPILSKLSDKLLEIPYLQWSVVSDVDSEKSVAVSVVWHESVNSLVETALSECAFIRCVHSGEFTAQEKLEELAKLKLKKQDEIFNTQLKIVAFNESVRDLKILSDYYSFELEKKESSDNFERTNSTFYLEGFVPKENENDVKSALTAFEGHIYSEYEELGEDDFAPTLMKNKNVKGSFEFVTNLYSAPKYLEFDPNAIMGFFFSVFLGFITADVVYGLLMIVGGLLFNAKSKRKTGINKLATVIVLAGIPTVLFGIGFDSWLGLPLLRNLNLIQTTFMPDPVSHTSVLAGITIPTLLLIALGMGVVHIMTSLCVLAYINFKKGKILDGICDGLIWAVFLGGLILLVLCEIGTVKGANNLAIALLLSSVVLGALTAGRNAKGFGKFTKGFGAVYGLINYMSDILSYARLYGLMLSGAKISEIFSQQLAVPMLESPGGVGGVIACVVIMLVGHLFNIAMGLLGAFIHDARLQYVEFFSHFYTGEGELFKPLGRKFEHIYLD